jgi:PAS domain S-box-containing protein
MKYKFKLRTEIIFLVTVITLGVGFFTTVLVGNLMRNAIKKELHKKAVIIVQTLAESIAHDVINKQVLPARELLQDIVFRTEDLDYAFLVDFDNRIFAHTFENGFPSDLLPDHLDNIQIKTEYPTFETILMDEIPILQVGYPLIEGMSAHLHIGINENRSYNQIRFIRDRILLITFAVTLLAVLVGLLISIRITRPLIQLTNFIQAYGKGSSIEKIDIKGESLEVAGLTKSFNRMIFDRSKMEKDLKRITDMEKKQHAKLQASYEQMQQSQDAALNMMEDLSLEVAERQQAEVALRESEEKFRNIVEQSTEGISVANEDGIVVEWNQSLQKITGLKSKDALGKNIWDIQIKMNLKEQQTPEIYKQLKENLIKFLKTGSMPYAGKQMVREYLHPDGSTKFIQGSVFPIKTTKGFMLGSISSDVSESKKAEELIKQSEKKFRTLVANIPGASYRCDYEPNWTMQYLSDKIEELTGYAASDFLNNTVRTYASIIHPDDKKMVEEVVFGAVDKKEPFSMEYRIIHVNGEERWIFENGQGVFDEKDNVLFLDGVLFDATERKRAEKLIRNSEANLKSLIDNREDYIWSLDRNYNYIAFNKTYAGWYLNTYKHEVKNGMSATKNLSPEENDFWIAKYDSAFQGENVTFELMYPIEGQDHHFMISINPIYTDGVITGASTINSDITERKQAEEALRESLDRSTALFEHAAIPIWDEDFSKVKKYIDKLREQGVEDFKTYFQKKPKEIGYVSSLVKVRDVNQSSLNFYNVRNKEELNKYLPDWFMEESLEVFRDEIVALAGGADQYECEIPVRTPQKEIKHLSVNLSILPDNKEPWDRVFVSFIDITERKQAEEKLRSSEKYLSDLTNTVADPIFTVNMPERKIEFANNAVTQLFGYKAMEILGNTTRLLYPNEKQYLKFRKKLKKAVEENKRQIKAEQQLITKNGKIIWTEIIVSFLYSKNQLDKVISVVRDITERKRAEENLQRRAQELTAFNILSQRVSSSLSIEQVSKETIRTVAEAVNPDLVLLFLRDGDNLTLIGFGPQKTKYLHSDTSVHRVGECLCGLAISKRKPLYSKNIDEDARCTWEKCKKAGLRSYAALPLRSGDNVIGVLGLASATLRDFSLQASFIETLSNEVAIGLQNALLYEQVNSRVHELSILLEINRTLAVTLNKQIVLQTIIDSATQLNELGSGAIYLLEGDNVYLGATSPPLPASLPNELRREALADHPHIKKCVTKRNYVYLPDTATADLTPAERTASESRGLRSVLYLPMELEKRVIGVLILATIGKTRDFDESEINLYRALSSQAALAVENASLYESVQKHAEELEQRVAERTSELKQSEENLKAQYKGIPVPTYTWQAVGRDLILKDFNDAALEITGGGVSNFVNVSAEKMYADMPDVLNDLRRCYNKKTNIEKEMPYLFKSTDEIKYLAVKYAFVPPDNVLVHTEDITERKRAEENLKEANIRLQEADRLKSVFLASMSHELRTPLNSIIGFTGVLLMGLTGELKPEQKKQLSMVKISANHLLNLINDILDISKIEAGKAELFLEEFSFPKILKEVVDVFDLTAKEKKVGLFSQVPKNVILYSDKRRVKQVLMNLVSNAIKFTDKGSVKVIGRKIKNDKLKVNVIDTGRGIKKERMNTLFTPFQQIDISLTKDIEGTGLGLYLSKNLLILLGGSISVKSEYGKGSEFTFVLPLKR